MKKQIQTLWHKHASLIYSSAGLLVASGFMQFCEKQPPKNVVSDEALTHEGDFEINTMIPRGHSLIPIEIKNSESMDSIFGNQGHVNLYIEKNGGQRLVGKNVKLLRAPKNPSHFAALVKDRETIFITQHEGPFFVSIVSESNSGTFFVKDKKQITNISIGVEHD